MCRNVIQACANGGAKCVEFTNRGDFAAHVFLEVTRHFARGRPVGDHGRRLDRRRADRRPSTSPTARTSSSARCSTPRWRRLCNRRGIPYSPGCGSATEIGDAQELGCEIVKVFPGASVGGPEFVRSVMAPMPWTRIMPTGGVEPTEESLRKWFGAGIVACGIGSNLITKELLTAKDYKGIEEKVRDTIALTQRIKGELGR